MNLRRNMRMVVAMWIFIGLLGGPSMFIMAAAAFTGTGPFRPDDTVLGAAQFAPGEEIRVGGTGGVDIRVGDFVVLAHPVTVEPSQVSCEWKTRVFSTGAQRSGTVEPVPVDGMTAVVTDPRNDVDYRPVLTTDGGTGWMEIDFMTCRGEGVETFAIAEAPGITESLRTTASTMLVIFGVLMTAMGFVSLVLTRRWSRERSAGGPPPYGPGGPGPYANGPGQYPHAYQR